MFPSQIKSAKRSGRTYLSQQLHRRTTFVRRNLILSITGCGKIFLKRRSCLALPSNFCIQHSKSEKDRLGFIEILTTSSITHGLEFCESLRLSILRVQQDGQFLCQRGVIDREPLTS